jgi:serine/threonine protein kinase
MPTATLPQVWRGRSTREYVPSEGARVRHGGMATVRKVVGRGGAVGTSSLPDGTPLALKLWTEADDASLDQLQAEARVLVEISQETGELPCPRLYDLIGTPLVTGLVMEWCPADLERWWSEKLREPDAFGRLMATLAEASRRVSDYHVYFATRKNLEAAHGDLKPTNILLSQDGRWLISDFGAARIRPPDDNPLFTTKVVGGSENFLTPEALFHARKRFPAAMDTWALGATAFALLRLQRMSLDGSQIPKNGTHSPRFRMQRVNQIAEVYARDPQRFHDRDLDAAAFPDPLRIPEEDRRAVLDALRGLFGPDGERREQQLARELLDTLDRAMSIEPKHRFTDARDLAAAFERLTRIYIELSAPPRVVAPLSAAQAKAEETETRLEQAQAELQTLRERLQEAQAQASYAEERSRVDLPDVTPVELPPPPRLAIPTWWSVALLAILASQFATMLAMLVVLALLIL